MTNCSCPWEPIKHGKLQSRRKVTALCDSCCCLLLYHLYYVQTGVILITHSFIVYLPSPKLLIYCGKASNIRRRSPHERERGIVARPPVGAECGGGRQHGCGPGLRRSRVSCHLFAHFVFSLFSVLILSLCIVVS